ncbi:DUF2158 domain-containing protein [Stenotrophobium rhamnosiphilum]
MTIRSLSENGESVSCQWFNGSTLEEAFFHVDTIVISMGEATKSTRTVVQTVHHVSGLGSNVPLL